MIGTTKDWCPYYQGRHYQAACGARLDPDRARFAQSADPGLHLVCQRPACVKAWKAMLVYPIGRLPSKKGSMQLQLWWTRRKGFFHRQGCFVLRCTPQDPLGFNSVIPEALHFFCGGIFVSQVTQINMLSCHDILVTKLPRKLQFLTFCF